MPDSAKDRPYKVFVDDNFHYMDEDERYEYGTYETLAAAIEVCQAIVERSLRNAYKLGLSAAELISQYRSFGDDPFIRGPTSNDNPVLFSAWTYASVRAGEICASGAPQDTN